MIENAWHITKKSNLKSIAREGLLPTCGERTDSHTDEPGVYFTLSRNSVLMWKDKLYPDENFDRLSILQLSIKQEMLKHNIWHKGSNVLNCRLREGALPADKLSLLKLFENRTNNQITFDEFISFYGQHASLRDEWLEREGLLLRATPIVDEFSSLVIQK